MSKIKHITFSEDGDKAYGKTNDFNNADEFIKAVQDQYYQEGCIVENIKIESCISTLECISAEYIIPLRCTDVVIENYFVATISENADGLENGDLIIESNKYQEKINAALYELELLHKKINPAENSNIDRHIKNIIWILQKS